MSIARGILIDWTVNSLVVKATPREVARFALGQSVGVADDKPANWHPDLLEVADFRNHGFIYDRFGRPIGAIQNIRMMVGEQGHALEVRAMIPQR